MEEKCLNKFLGLFDRFNAVAFFVANGFTDNDNTPLTGIEDIINKLGWCGAICKDHEDWNILNTALNEIKQNLWSLSPDNRVIYLKSIIRKFVDLSLYTNNNYTLCIEDIKSGACSKKDSNKRYLYLLQIQEFLKGAPPFHEQTPAQQYIFLCAETLYRFEYELGRICEDFDINFMKLQEDLGIYLRKWKEYEGNYNYVEYKLSNPDKQPMSLTLPDGMDKILVPSTLGSLTKEKTKELHELSLSALNACTIEEFIYYILHPTLGKLSSNHQGKTFILITALLKAKIINDPHQILLALGKDVNKYAKHPVGNANSKTGGAENLFAEKLEKLLNIGILDN